MTQHCAMFPALRQDNIATNAISAYGSWSHVQSNTSVYNQHTKLSAAPIPNNEHFTQRNLRLHGAEPFWRSPHFTEPEGLLLHSQEPATCHYYESHQPKYTALLYFLETHFNIILPSTSVFQMVSIPQVSTPKPLWSSPRPMPATCPTHFILIGFTTLIIFGEGYRRWNSLSCLLYSPVKKPSIFLSILPQYLQPMLLPQCYRPSLTPL
jgi:hypothetical protein